MKIVGFIILTLILVAIWYAAGKETAYSGKVKPGQTPEVGLINGRNPIYGKTPGVIYEHAVGGPSCQVSSAALAECKNSINAYVAAIQAAQKEAQDYAAAATKRNAEIVAWESEYARQLQKRDEGRIASSNQVWYNNIRYDCNKIPAGS